jgi:hypothetical protein
MIVHVRHESKCIIRTGSIDQWESLKLIRHIGACSIDEQARTQIGQILLHDSQARDAEGLLAECSAARVDEPVCRQHTSSVDGGLAARLSTELRQGLGHYED